MTDCLISTHQLVLDDQTVLPDYFWISLGSLSSSSLQNKGYMDLKPWGSREVV